MVSDGGLAALFGVSLKTFLLQVLSCSNAFLGGQIKTLLNWVYTCLSLIKLSQCFRIFLEYLVLFVLKHDKVIVFIKSEVQPIFLFKDDKISSFALRVKSFWNFFVTMLFINI